jgi:NAD+ synthase
MQMAVERIIKMIDTWLEQAPFLKLDEELTIQMLITALQAEVEKAGFQKMILGLSGGIDSALALYLAVKALGKQHVTAVRMPYKTSHPSSLADAQAMIDATGVYSLTIDITPQIDAYFASRPEATPLRRGNKMARERMSILYDLSAYDQALVIGTSNRTELLLGYGTQFGDVASAINPLGDLYKTQVRQLSAYIGVPEQILRKPPSADLWENQTDEEELGFSYFDVDRLLYHMVDQGDSFDRLRSLRFADEFIKKVSRRILQSQYKRVMPIILKVGKRAVEVDSRYLRGWSL